MPALNLPLFEQANALNLSIILTGAATDSYPYHGITRTMSKQQRKKILYALIGTLYALIALVAVIIALIPTVTQIAFRHWLEQQHLQGDIAHIGLGLNTGTLTILDAEIRDGQSPLLKLGKLQVRIKLGDLLDHKLTIERVELTDTRVQLQQLDNALVVAGINLKQTGTTPPASTTQNQVAQTPWMVQLQKLHIANLDTCLTSTKTRQPLAICNHLGELSWQGSISLNSDAPLKLKSTGTLVISHLDLRDEKQKLSLLRFDSLALTNININSLDQMKLGQLALQQLTMLPNPGASAKRAPTLSFGKLLIHSVSVNRMNDIDIAAIRIEDIATYIKLNPNNSIASLSEVSAYRPIESDGSKHRNKPAATPATQNPVKIKIGKIVVTTTKSLVLEDAHSKPAITQRIDHFSFSLGAIDNRKPSQASALAMQFNYGKYGKVKAKGTIQPFAVKPTVDLKASIVGLNLNRVSPYTRELLQHKIKSGQLNAQLTVKIDQGKLDSEAKLTLQKFYVTQLSGKEADKYQKDLGIPLSAALALLRDKNDAIKIDLPVTGDVENPDFSLNDIIATVSAKAIKVAIVNYYATLGLVKRVTGAFDLMTALRFDPLQFMPGQTGLSDASRTALDKFSTMLQDRPQVHLVVCGHATVADQLKLFPVKNNATDAATGTDAAKAAPLTEQQLQQLNKLAQARSDQVKQYLVEQKGVAADRLIECNPEYNASDTHSPYLELHI